MKQGDFTKLAKEYINRPGYSPKVLIALARYVGAFEKSFFVTVDVGAGTGKLTQNLIDLDLHGYAIEPNKAMRDEGIFLVKNTPFMWLDGSAENTRLNDSSVDWILMGSSFHWTSQQDALKEFFRVLKPGGFFTTLWNPRNLEKSSLHQKIEKRIYGILPSLKRVSSGSHLYTNNLEQVLLQSCYFKNLIFIEAPHEEKMNPKRYLGAWRSVNDIQVQAGPIKFEEILEAIKEEISGLEYINVPYKTRSWTIQSTKK